MAQTVHYGFQGGLYFSPAASYGSPSFTLIPNVKEVKIGFELNKEDATTRLGGGWKQYEPTMGALSVSGKIRTDEGDTSGYVALETATLTGAALDVMAITGLKTVDGNRGVRYIAKNFKWAEDQDAKAVLFREFELAPAIADNPPSKVVIASNIPVFTSMAR